MFIVIINSNIVVEHRCFIAIIIIIIVSYKPCTSGTMVPAATVPLIDVKVGYR
jgi:hypothetical protein